MRTKRIWIVTSFIAISVMPALSGADDVKLQRDDVIPVVMQTELDFRRTREGDRFKAEVSDSRMLPWGSKLEGVVNRVEGKHGDQPAYMDIEFRTIILPDGHRQAFRGTPIAMSKNYVTQDRYGRWEAKKGVKKDTVVLGSIAGGFILGSMIRKPFEGAILGAIVGIIGAETQKEQISDGNLVIPKGSKVGARVEDDLSIEFNGRWDNQGSNNDHGYGPYDRDGFNRDGFDRYGYDRNGKYNPRYDSARGGERLPDRTGDRDRDNYNSAGYDKRGYDRDGHYNPRWDSTREDRTGNDRDSYDKEGRNDPRRETTSDRILRIEIDGKELKFAPDERPFKEGWVLMVPLESTADQLGYLIEKNRSGSFRIESGVDVLTVEQDSKGYRLNDRRGSLPSEVQIKSGVTFVPIDAFTKLAKGSVYVNGTKYRPQA
jgi:hypothetical protein